MGGQDGGPVVRVDGGEVVEVWLGVCLALYVGVARAAQHEEEEELRENEELREKDELREGLYAVVEVGGACVCTSRKKCGQPARGMEAMMWTLFGAPAHFTHQSRPPHIQTHRPRTCSSTRTTTKIRPQQR